MYFQRDDQTSKIHYKTKSWKEGGYSRSSAHQFMQQEVEREMNGSQRKEKLLHEPVSTFPPTLHPTPSHAHTHSHTLTALPPALQSSSKEIKDQRSLECKPVYRGWGGLGGGAERRLRSSNCPAPLICERKGCLKKKKKEKKN